MSLNKSNLPPAHAILEIRVSAHSLSYLLTRDDRILKQEDNLNSSPETFSEIQAFCIRGGFFDVRILSKCDCPSVKDMCAIVAEKYSWNLTDET
jgi:hypothetical protein